MGKRTRRLFLEAKRLLETYGQRFCIGIKGWSDELFDGFSGEKSCMVLWFDA